MTFFSELGDSRHELCKIYCAKRLDYARVEVRHVRVTSAAGPRQRRVMSASQVRQVRGGRRSAAGHNELRAARGDFEREGLKVTSLAFGTSSGRLLISSRRDGDAGAPY